MMRLQTITAGVLLVLLCTGGAIAANTNTSTDTDTDQPVLSDFAPIVPSPLPVSSQDRKVSERLVIGVDISEGSPFLTDEQFAKKTAERIGNRIERLPLGAVASLRSFGAHSTMDASLELDRFIGRGRSGRQAAIFLRAIIAGMPKLASSGKIKAQSASNILGFLQTVSRRVDCAGERTTIIIATDGLEDSEYAKLASDDSLPAPASPMFEGCARLEMLGLGRGGGSARLTTRVIEAWEAWGEAAGFRSVVILDNW